MESTKMFYEAVLSNQVNKVLSMMERSGDIDLNWSNPNNGFKTPLHVATEASNSVLIALLVGKGASVSSRDEEGRTPLNIALESDNKEIMSLLANKTVASLEDALRQNPHSHSRRDQNPLDGYRRLYKPPSEAVVVDSQGIQARLDKITEPYRATSIFQCHTPRDSPITEMMKISHFQTIYNIFVAVFLISLTNYLITNYYEAGHPLDIQPLLHFFRGFHYAAGYWFIMVCCSCFVVVFQKGVLNGFWSPTTAFVFFIILNIINLIATPRHIILRNFGTATNAFVMCECVRISMKTYSYMAVNNLLRIAKLRDDPDPMVKQYPHNISFYDWIRFLCFPTLIYQTSYPRTSSVDWSVVVRRFSEVGLCILYIYAILLRYCWPYYDEFTGDINTLFLGVFKVMLPGIGINLLGFFLLLHSWLNGWAELTRFADRHFYSDWWNSTSWSVYYRKWNFVVHNFIHRHVFTELILLRFSKTTAMWVTFVISAIIHEYIIAAALGFYKPILMIMFLIPGVLFIYLTKVIGQGSRVWNVFMWAMLIVGHGMLIALYSRAWNKYQTSPDTFYSSPLDLIWIL